MAKIAKKKTASAKIFPNWTTEAKSVLTRIFILGSVERDLNGRNNRKVRRPDTLFMPGIEEDIAVRTTIKSNQFQASLR
jgi:hypothetical protein